MEKIGPISSEILKTKNYHYMIYFMKIYIYIHTRNFPWKHARVFSWKMGYMFWKSKWLFGFSWNARHNSLTQRLVGQKGRENKRNYAFSVIWLEGKRRENEKMEGRVFLGPNNFSLFAFGLNLAKMERSTKFKTCTTFFTF